MRRLIGLDPGGSTGWCVRLSDGAWAGGTFDEPNHHCKLFRHLLDYGVQTAFGSDPVIVCERFNYQRRDLEQGVSLILDSRNYIGVTELFSQMYSIELYMSQVANKNTWSDTNLKALGLYSLGSKHTRDAIRHCLWYATNIERDKQYLEVKRA